MSSSSEHNAPEYLIFDLVVDGGVVVVGAIQVSSRDVGRRSAGRRKSRRRRKVSIGRERRRWKAAVGRERGRGDLGRKADIGTRKVRVVLACFSEVGSSRRGRKVSIGRERRWWKAAIGRERGRRWKAAIGRERKRGDLGRKAGIATRKVGVVLACFSEVRSSRRRRRKVTIGRERRRWKAGIGRERGRRWKAAIGRERERGDLGRKAGIATRKVGVVLVYFPEARSFSLKRSRRRRATTGRGRRRRTPGRNKAPFIGRWSLREREGSRKAGESEGRDDFQLHIVFFL